MTSIERRIGELECKEGMGQALRKICVIFGKLDDDDIRIASAFGGDRVLHREAGEPIANFKERAFRAFGTDTIAIA